MKAKFNLMAGFNSRAFLPVKLFLFSVALLVFTSALVFSAQGDMTIGGVSDLDVLDYDVDTIHIKLEKLESRWQLSPVSGKLFVEKLRARRLLITMRENTKKTGNFALPDHIKLPFSIKIQQAEVGEVVLITPRERFIFNNVNFALEADAKTIRLNKLSALTPLGQTEAVLNIATSTPFALTGSIKITQGNIKKLGVDKNGGKIPYALTANLTGNLKALKFESAAVLVLQGNQLSLIEADDSITKTKNAIAQLRVNGKITLQDGYPLVINTQISNFYPERLGSYPAGLLNVDINLQGNLDNKNDIESGLEIDFTAHDSYIKTNHIENVYSQNVQIEQPFISTGKMTFINHALRHIELQATVANNTFTAHGDLAIGQASLENNFAWRVDLPNTAALGASFSGKAHANGLISGTYEQPAIQLELNAQKINLPDAIKLEKLEGRATLLAGSFGKFEASLNATGLKIAKNPLVDSIISLQGTRANHQLKIQALTQGEANAMHFQTMLIGGLAGREWQGMIQRFELKGQMPITLQAPAKLRLSTKTLALENAVLQLAKGRAVVESLTVNKKGAAQGAGFASKGSLLHFALEDVPSSFFKLPSDLQGNPSFSGKWDIHAADVMNGVITLKLESGDLAITNGSNKARPLGLQEVNAQLQINNNKILLETKIAGKQLGYFDARITTVATKVDTGFALMANAPLTIESSAELNTLAWLPLPDALSGASVDGALQLNLQAKGTLQQPHLEGMATGKNLQINLPLQGVVLTDGLFEATFENEQLRIIKAQLKGGNGYLNASGMVIMENKLPKVELDWVANQFTVTSTSDRLLVVAGKGKTILAKDTFSVSGDFNVVKGLVELAKDDVPTLEDDVIVLGRNESPNEAGLKILLNGLRIDLGEDFTLRGRGLNAQLSGAVVLSGLTQYLPHTEGSIKVEKGTYMAYGQVLNITRGILNFNGPVDNPSLSIRAMRNAVTTDITQINTRADNIQQETTNRNSSQNNLSFGDQAVNAGVEITGNGVNPIIKLVSEPNVPDTEKLSWLVLGHGTSQAGSDDFAVLSLAAGAVLSQGESLPLQTKLARAAGLDEFSFSGSDAQSASLTLGKRLTSQLYLSYQKSISGLLNVARLTFNFTPRWALQVEAGTQSAVDVLYTFSFK